jgi:hypothetical protein
VLSVEPRGTSPSSSANPSPQSGDGSARRKGPAGMWFSGLAQSLKSWRGPGLAPGRTSDTTPIPIFLVILPLGLVVLMVW